MKILNFIKQLLPRLDKDRVLEDLRLTSTELDTVVIPSYTHASEYFRSNKIKSDANKDLSDIFYRKFDLQGTSKSSTFVGDIARRLPYLRDNIEYVKGLIEELMERDIIGEGLTAKKAVLLRSAEQMSFISRFATDLLNLMYVNEAIASDANIEENLRLSQHDVNMINKNIGIFSAWLSDQGIPNKDYIKLYLNIPEVVVNTRNENAIISAYKEKDLDPFSAPFVSGFTGSPIYTVRLIVAEWQSARFKANKDKKKMLELRLLHLNLINEKKNDPKIEQEIDYIRGRVERIESYIRETEESLAGA